MDIQTELEGFQHRFHLRVLNRLATPDFDRGFHAKDFPNSTVRDETYVATYPAWQLLLKTGTWYGPKSHG